MNDRQTIIVTGANGFIGKNLMLRLGEAGHFKALPLRRDDDEVTWHDAIARADGIIHLAGVNRPPEPSGFGDNLTATDRLAKAIRIAGKPIPVIYASSSRAAEGTPYGESKRACEDVLRTLVEQTGSPVHIFRLPNVFGKWCRPNYNSAVATFCYNIARGLPITVHDHEASLSLVYIDDVLDAFIAVLDGPSTPPRYPEVRPVYQTTVGNVADCISGFRADRENDRIADVGTGLTRALYATYISYLMKEQFAYPLVAHRDPRGTFAEMLKTRVAGQFSYFNALPGVTRGGHYHHTKTEKFLVVYGQALFRFRHMSTGETHEVRTSAETPMVVETIPGWTHDITNVGDGVLVSLLWANEIFDRDRPDTIAERV